MDNLKKLRQNQISLNCEICDKGFTNKNGLKQRDPLCLKYHFNVTHNSEKKHQCNICQKVFYIKSQLTSHVKFVHENKKPHKCDSCDKSFSQAGKLKVHINSVHNDQKDHKCDSCIKSFTQACSLKLHTH